MNKTLFFLFFWISVIAVANGNEQNLALGKVYQDSAHKESILGDIPKSVALFYKSIDFYAKVPHTEVQVSDIYYMLASIYLQTLDTNALFSVVRKMELLTKKSDDPFCFFNFYSVKSVYFETLLNHNAPRSLADSAILYSELSVDLIEKHPKSLSSKTMPSWNYYNLAVLYDKYTQPYPAVKINELLEKALQYKPTNESDVKEVKISVYELKAWMYYKEKNYALAETTMKKVFHLLNSIKERENTIQVEWYEATKFMVILYEETHQLDSALKYQKMFQEVSNKRFNLERTELINKMELKYEVKTKDLQIELLTQKAEINNKRLWVLGLSLVLVLTAFVLWRLRFKNREQERYEAALESELSSAHPTSLLVSDLTLNMLKDYIQLSILPEEVKQKYIQSFEHLNIENLNVLLKCCSIKLSSMDVKYICCFYIQMETKDIASVFHIEVSSVNTVRYRLRKKIGSKII